MNAPRFDVVLANAGPLFFDLILADLDGPPTPGKEVYAQSARTVPGGTFTTAAHLATLGVRVGLRAILGNDPFSRFIVESIEELGIARDFIEFRDEPRRAITVAASRGDRMLLTYVDPLPEAERAENDLGWLADQRDTIVHWGGLTLGPRLPTLLDTLRAQGCVTSMDAQSDPPPMTRPDVHAVLSRLDHFVPNDLEAREMTGQGAPRNALVALAALVPTVVVKEGAQGAWGYSVDEGVPSLDRPPNPRHVPAFSVAAVDTTGAGDSFNAGYLYGLVRGVDLITRMRIGCAVAARSVTYLGGFSRDHALTRSGLAQVLGDAP